MSKRAALVTESGAPAVNPTPRRVIPEPPEALNPTPSMGTGNLYCTAPPSVPVGVTPTAICIAPPPLSTSLLTGAVISIAPPSSRCQPVPVPPTGTAIFIAPPPPQDQPLPAPNNVTCASDPHSTVATQTRVSQIPSAPIDLSMVNATSRLHQRHHTRPCRLHFKILARIIAQESPTPLTRPTLFTPLHPSNPPPTRLEHLTTRPRVGSLV